MEYYNSIRGEYTFNDVADVSWRAEEAALFMVLPVFYSEGEGGNRQSMENIGKVIEEACRSSSCILVSSLI